MTRARSNAVPDQEDVATIAEDILRKDVGNTLKEERNGRDILGLISDILSASWALESAQYNQVRPSLLGSLGTRKTNDACYEEACEGRVCQCCNCVDCWAC